MRVLYIDPNVVWLSNCKSKEKNINNNNNKIIKYYHLKDAFYNNFKDKFFKSSFRGSVPVVKAVTSAIREITLSLANFTILLPLRFSSPSNVRTNHYALHNRNKSFPKLVVLLVHLITITNFRLTFPCASILVLDQLIQNIALLHLIVINN